MNNQFQKVIDGLRHHAGLTDCDCCHVEGTEILPDCPYYDDKDNGEPVCGTKLLMDAIELLKEYDSALRGMVYQYCTTQKQFLKGKECDMPNQEVFFHSYMSAGEEAFKVLGIQNGEEPTEDFVWN